MSTCKPSAPTSKVGDLYQPDEYKWNTLPSELPACVSHVKNWYELEDTIEKLFPV